MAPSSLPSSDEAPILAEFRESLGRFTRKAVCSRQYVRFQKFFDEWMTIDNIRALLFETWPEKVQPDIAPAAVIHDHRKIFCILLFIGRGRELQHFVADPKWRDNFLPFNSEDFLQWLLVTNIENADQLEKDFYKAQWQFCPHIYRLEDLRRQKEGQILPINNIRSINLKSGHAVLWEIEVLAEFVAADLQKEVDNARYRKENDPDEYFHFALKTFPKEHEKIFESEKEAFTALRGHTGVVKCLGHFVQRIHLDNLHLQQKKHMHTWYRKDEKIITTYNILLEYAEMDLDEFFRNLHPPFLPNEIRDFWQELVNIVAAVEQVHNWNPPGSRKNHKGWFADIKPDNILLVAGKVKLADPGFAKFIIDSSKYPTTKVQGGTRSFGAPEHEPGKELHQSVDIWSLGCVFSIAATWVVSGLSGVRDFEVIRVRAKRRSGINNDIFHDGLEVLSDVTEWHKIICGNARRTDPITPQILQLVENHMLRGEPKLRKTANELRVSLEEILNQETAETQPIPTHILEALVELDKTAAIRPQSSTSTGAIPYMRDGLSDREREKQLVMGIPLRKTALRTQALDRALRESQDARLPLSRPESYERHTRSLSKIPGTSGGYQTSLITPPRPQLSISQVQQREQRGLPAGIKEQNIFQAYWELEKAEVEANSLRARLFGGHLFKKEFNRDRTMESNGFENRDMRFLVDRASSMTAFWPQARLLLEILALKCRCLDNNGLDCNFTNSTRKLRNKQIYLKPVGHSIFYKTMAEPDIMPVDDVPRLPTDMKHELGLIFQEYLDYIRQPFPQRKKFMTLIVLTDGLWQGMNEPDDLKEQIANFVKKVTHDPQFSQISRPVSIQFVQFGNDADATERLRSLDNDLPWEKKIKDVIDVEHADGNTNKMLLGSFNENWDAADGSPQASPSLSPTMPTREDYSIDGIIRNNMNR